MPTIADFYNSGLMARQNQTRGKYLDPQLAAATSIAQTQAQYLPEQYQLANAHQSLINKYYGRNIESEINSRDVNTKYKPLEVAITAQNSVRNNSRFSDASNFIRSVNSMKSGDQELFLGDPDNNAAYMNALKQVQTGITGGSNNANLITTPKFLKQFGFDMTGEGAAPAGLAANPNGQPPPQQNAPVAPVPQQQGGIGAPLPGVQPPMQPPVQQNAQPAAQPAGLAQPHPAVEQAVVKTIAEEAPNKELTMAQRQVLARQAISNQKVAGAPLWNRAQGAVILEKYIQDNKDTFAPRLKNATEYVRALGKSKLLADKLAKKTPQTLIDYNWVMNDFIPNLGNNVKVMEKLASTDEQRKVLNDMQANAYNWYMDPEGSIKALNMNFDLFHRQAEAILGAAQSIFPGALEKLNGLTKPKGDYIEGKKDIKNESTEDLLRMYQEAS